MNKRTVMKSNEPLVLFDGVCNLCSASVQFIIKHDRKEQFRFAALQSPIGKKITSKSGGSSNTRNTKLDSVLLQHNNQIYRKSSAALHTLKLLGGIWSVLYVFIIIPAPIRDAVYDFIGKRRYRWFGKKDQCWLPDKSLKKRFLDQD